MTIMLHEIQMIPPEKLTVDENNPNRMSNKERKALASSLRKYGFVVPIITNKDLLIADGQQRWEVAKDVLKMTHVPVIALQIEDVDRRLIRQVMNKLKGKHDFFGDAEEFLKIQQAGREKDLINYIGISESKLRQQINALYSERGGAAPEKDLYATEGVISCPACGHEFNPVLEEAE